MLLRACDSLIIKMVWGGDGCNSSNIIEALHGMLGVQGKGHADDSRHDYQCCVRFRAVITLTYCVLSNKSKYFWRISLCYNLHINIITYFKMFLCNHHILEVVISLFVFV